MARRGVLSSIPAVVALATTVAAQPRLSLTQELIDGRNGVTTLDGARALAVSSTDGAFVHVVATSDSDDALTTFSRSPTTGHLTLVEAEVEGADSVVGLDGARVVGVSPDGGHIYVGGVAIVIFGRNAVTGATTYESTQTYTERMSGMAFSPGGEHAYVTTDVPSASAELEVYERDGGTGALTLVQQVSDGQGGVDGLERASCVAVSPDGKHVYVGGRFDDAIAAFERDLVTGELTFLQQYVDGAGGIDGLRRPEAIVVSPDGAQVYVGGGDAGLVQFDRDAGTGLLTFVEHAGIDARVISLAIGADGTRLAAANTGADPDRVALILRDTGSGTLTEASQEALDDVRAVTISPDGAHVYAVAPESAAVFRIVTTGCSATPLAGCLSPTLSQKALLQLKDSPDDEADKLTAKWVKGAAFSIGDFGDPIDQPDDVMTCVYDASGDPQPVLEALVPGLGSCRGKPCWKTNSSGTTLKYKDSGLLPDGISTLTAKAAAAGQSSVKVKGKRSALPMPALPLTPPVRLQVQASTGTCWEAVFSTPITNDAEQFKAKGD